MTHLSILRVQIWPGVVLIGSWISDGTLFLRENWIEGEEIGASQQGMYSVKLVHTYFSSQFYSVLSDFKCKCTCIKQAPVQYGLP